VDFLTSELGGKIMAISGLNLPTDIAWERICVSADMLDKEPCDQVWPAKWHTSIAIFRYKPTDEYQVYPNRRILYYKVVCTITGYQPADQEITGSINWSGVSADDIANFQALQNTYLPCNGAVIQVTVAPHEEMIALADYPYFMDFQPKQRALYEQASDSQERVSRSLESLSVSKGAGGSQSTEVLDIDQGFSVGMQGSYAGTGGGFNVSRQGQWGTKNMSQEDQSNIRTTDSQREARDTVSHTTQISQMYNLLQAYHQGTNRALFYLAPRPHVLEEPSGFIRGPRVLDGIQEFFLIVNQDAQQGDPCLSVRLDTAHLTQEDVMDVDRSKQAVPLEIVKDVPAPAKDDGSKTPAESNNPLYDCYDLMAPVSDSTTAPEGYHIEFIDDLINEARNGSTTFDITPDNKTVTLTGDVHSHACFRNAAGDDANVAALGAVGGPIGLIAAAAGADIIPETINEDAGHIKRSLLVHFVSDQKITKVGEAWVLKVVSRGLCCCDRRWHEVIPPKLISVIAFDPIAAKIPWPRIAPLASRSAPMPPPAPERTVLRNQAIPSALNARQANVLSKIVGETLRTTSASVADLGAQPSLSGTYLLAGLINKASVSRVQQRRMSTALLDSDLLPVQSVRRLAKLIGKEPEQVTRYDAIIAPDATLLQASRVRSAALTGLRLKLLGFPPKPDEGPERAARPRNARAKRAPAAAGKRRKRPAR
jgi:hypothetical protein